MVWLAFFHQVLKGIPAFRLDSQKADAWQADFLSEEIGQQTKFFNSTDFEAEHSWL